VLAERHGRPTWKPPGLYGYAETIQSAGMVVAPLLAGFTIALIGLLVDSSSDNIRYSNLALMVLVASAVLLVAAIQCAYAARQYVVRPDEIEAWWPGIEDETDPGQEWRWRDLRAEQLAHREMHSLWAGRFRHAYHLGILLVFVGLALVLMPPRFPDAVGAARWGAIAIATVAVIGEAIWIVVSGRTERAAQNVPSDRRTPRQRLREDGFLGWLSPSYVKQLTRARAQLEAEKAP
jgi:hypothetical protein